MVLNKALPVNIDIQIQKCWPVQIFFPAVLVMAMAIPPDAITIGLKGQLLGTVEYV